MDCAHGPQPSRQFINSTTKKILEQYSQRVHSLLTLVLRFSKNYGVRKLKASGI